MMESTTFDDLDDEIVIQIAQYVPLNMCCMSQLNLRAKRLHLSEFQALLSRIAITNLSQLEQYAGASLLHLSFAKR